MRAAGLALLAATTCNCNSIFKIDQSQPWDARLPIDAADYPARITWQTYLGGSDVMFDPIEGLAVQVGALDATTTTTMPVTVDPTTGEFKIPNLLAQKATRVLFNSPYDGVPTEIQSTLQGFIYAFPSFGRHGAARAAAGSDAMFTGSATGTVPAYTNERLLTMGLWAVDDAKNAPSNGAFAFGYGSADSLSGPLGVPDGTQGDREVVVYMTTTAADVGFAVFSGGLAAGTASFMTTSPVAIAPDISANINAGTRVSDATVFQGTPNPMYWAGVIAPTTKMPAFAQPLGAATGPIGAPPPVLLPLDESHTDGANSFSFQNPFDGAHGTPALQLAVYSAAFTTRQTMSGGRTISLTTAVQGVVLSSPTAASPREDVGIAESNASSAFAIDGSDLTADMTAIAIGSEPMMSVTFGTDQPVDDCTATLFRIESGAFVPAVRYIAMAFPTTILVDTHYLDTSSTYTFGVECELGHDPMAIKNNDYTQTTYPFSISSTFVPLFTVTN